VVAVWLASAVTVPAAITAAAAAAIETTTVLCWKRTNISFICGGRGAPEADSGGSRIAPGGADLERTRAVLGAMVKGREAGTGTVGCAY
jgi:hypothetical protein